MLVRILIDCLVFYAVSAVTQPCNNGNTKKKPQKMKENNDRLLEMSMNEKNYQIAQIDWLHVRATA